MHTPLTSVTHYIPLTVLRRERLLPVPGKVVVRKGQRVGTTDVVAEGNLNSEHLLLDVARGLGVSYARADELIQRQAGEKVSEGDVIAGPVGLARRVVRAPKSGRVILAGSGQVLVEVDNRPYELRAGLPGVISELIGDRGVQIEMTGALIQGVWGNGKVDDGLLSILIQSPFDTLTPDQLDVNQRGLIVVSGYADDPAIFTTGAELPIRGIVLASMDWALQYPAEKAPFPVILLEGFGRIPMNAVAYRLLTTSDRREAAANAERWNHYTASRPELLIPLPATSQVSPPKGVGYLTPGKQVRVISPPYQGQVGAVVVLRPGMTLLPSGVRAPSVEVRLESGENAVVPVANLEILE